MKVLILGNDGPTHALVWKLFNSDRVDQIVSSPGNGGAGVLAPVVATQESVAATAQWAFNEGFNLIVPAGGVPLQEGLVEAATPMRLAVWGPPRPSAMINRSRLWAKEFLNRYQLPSAAGRVFGDQPTAERYLAAQPLPVVLWGDYASEYDGAYMERGTAMNAIAGIFGLPPEPDHFRGVVIEAPLVGPSIAYSCLTDGETLLPLLPVRTYDRLEDHDRGWAAPGMGGHTSSGMGLMRTGEYLQRFMLQPLLAALKQEQLPWWGVLGVDCVIAADGPKITRIRCTLGDPEAQVVLPRLEDDLFSLIAACNNRSLHTIQSLRWKPGASVGVSLVAQGYPHSFPSGIALDGLGSLDPGVLAFQSQTLNPLSMEYISVEAQVLEERSLLSGFAQSFSEAMLVRATGPTRLVAQGGRPITLVALGPDLATAREHAYANIKRLAMQRSIYRTDIGIQEL